MKKAFTLVELMIVVSILGILAAFVLPSLQGETVRAREAAAMNTVKTMRNQIELYTFHHRDLAPGIANGASVTKTVLAMQFTNCTKLDGSASLSTTPSGDYVFGPYVPKIPANIYNGLRTFKIVPVGTDFSAAADDSSGWLYKIETAEVRINSTKSTENGIKHYEL